MKLLFAFVLLCFSITVSHSDIIGTVGSILCGLGSLLSDSVCSKSADSSCSEPSDPAGSSEPSDSSGSSEPSGKTPARDRDCDPIDPLFPSDLIDKDSAAGDERPCEKQDFEDFKALLLKYVPNGLKECYVIYMLDSCFHYYDHSVLDSLENGGVGKKKIIDAILNDDKAEELEKGYCKVIDMENIYKSPSNRKILYEYCLKTFVPKKPKCTPEEASRFSELIKPYCTDDKLKTKAYAEQFLICLDEKGVLEKAFRPYCKRCKNNGLDDPARFVADACDNTPEFQYSYCCSIYFGVHYDDTTEIACEANRTRLYKACIEEFNNPYECKDDSLDPKELQDVLSSQCDQSKRETSFAKDMSRCLDNRKILSKKSRSRCGAFAGVKDVTDEKIFMETICGDSPELKAFYCCMVEYDSGPDGKFSEVKTRIDAYQECLA